jgi:hypothetical protein
MRKVSESTLIRHCKWAFVHGAFWLVDEYGVTKGNRAKFVAYPDRIVAPIQRPPYRYYWKESLPRYPIEFWSEVLAYHIGGVVGVQVPPCFPATYTQMEGPLELPEREGSLSLSLVQPDMGEDLRHGGDLLSIVKPDYERKRGSDHSVQLIIKALRDLVGDVSLYTEFFRQLVFDALIGNSDRHQDNWGIKATRISPTGSYKFEMLPAFDNGTSLGRELTEAKIESCLRNPSELAAFINRGKAHVRWEENKELLQLTHEDLMRKHLEAFPKSRSVVEEIVAFDEGPLVRAIHRVCELSRSPGTKAELRITFAREDFVTRVILERRERLRKL